MTYNEAMTKLDAGTHVRRKHWRMGVYALKRCTKAVAMEADHQRARDVLAVVDMAAPLGCVYLWTMTDADEASDEWEEVLQP